MRKVTAFALLFAIFFSLIGNAAYATGVEDPDDTAFEPVIVAEETVAEPEEIVTAEEASEVSDDLDIPEPAAEAEEPEEMAEEAAEEVTEEAAVSDAEEEQTPVWPWEAMTDQEFADFVMQEANRAYIRSILSGADQAARASFCARLDAVEAGELHSTLTAFLANINEDDTAAEEEPAEEPEDAAAVEEEPAEVPEDAVAVEEEPAEVPEDAVVVEEEPAEVPEEEPAVEEEAEEVTEDDSEVVEETADEAEEYFEIVEDTIDVAEPEMATTSTTKVSSVSIAQGKTIVVDVRSQSRVTLSASCLPAGSNQNIQWSSSIKADNGTYRDNGNGTVTLYNLKLKNNKATSFTVKAVSAESKSKSATITVKLVAAPKATELHITGATTVAAGKSESYKVTINADVTEKDMVWSIREQDTAYASVSSSGKLKVSSKLPYAVSVRLTAAVKSKPSVSVSYTVRLVPKATSAQITRNGSVVGDTLMWDLRNGSTISLSGKTLPADASNAGTWKSSSTKTATVDANGKVTILKSGTFTITFSASDGSSKKASVKITALMPVTTLRISANSTMSAGQKQTVIVVMNANATNPKLEWTTSNSKVATVSSKGVVSAKAAGTVTITARATDGSGKYSSVTIQVLPKVEKIMFTFNGSPRDYDGSRVYGYKTVQMGVIISPVGANPAGTWKSSNPSVASISQSGLLTIHTLGKTNITFTSDSGKSAKYIIIVEELG